MPKTRIINEIKTTMIDKGLVDICGGEFECESELAEGTKVRAIIDFDDIEITDDADDGVIAATVINSIYKGSYYQCLLKTDDNFIFFSDTDDDWLKGDRVGIRIPKDKIIIEEINEESESN